MNMNKKGLTLVESMVALAAAGTVTAAVLSSKMEDFEKSEMLSLLHDTSTITLAVDHRIAIDGYSMENWGISFKDNTKPLSWSDIDKIMKDLILEELTSTDSTLCKKGGWESKLDVESETKLLDCNLWAESKPEGFNISASLIPDENGFIEEFHTILSFEDEDSFQENYQNIKYAVNNFNNNNKQFIKGHHKIEFISLSTGENILTTECISNNVDCGVKIGFKINLDASDDGYFGGEEFVRVDGGNSVIANHLTFMKSVPLPKDEAPYKCVEWVNKNGSWKQNEISCGIGLYQGKPTTVSVNAQTGSFSDHIVLRNKCKLFTVKSDNTVEQLNDEVPCGIVKESKEVLNPITNTMEEVKTVIQVIERYSSEIAYFQELYSNKGYFNEISEVKTLKANIADINDLIVDALNVDTLKIERNLIGEKDSSIILEGKTDIKGIATFKEQQSFNNEVVFKNDLNLTTKNGSPVVIDGNTNINIANPTFDSLVIDGYVSVSEDTAINNLNADNITAGSVELKDLKTNVLNMTSGSTLTSAQKIKANIGNFDNINNQLNIIKSYVNNQIYVVQNKEDNYAGWSNTGGLHSCSGWTPSTSSKPKGQAFTQTRSCKQNQIRNQHFYELWKNSNGVLLKKEHIGSKQHSRQTSIPQSRTAIGTKSTSTGGSGGSCHSKCQAAPNRDYYNQCVRRCSGGGSGGNPNCGANGCGNNGGGRS